MFVILIDFGYAGNSIELVVSCLWALSENPYAFNLLQFPSQHSGDNTKEMKENLI